MLATLARRARARRRRPTAAHLLARLCVVLLATGLVVGVGLPRTTASPALGDDIDDARAAAEQQQEDIAAQLEATQAELEDLSGELAEAAQAVAELQAQVASAKVELATAQTELAQATREQQVVAARLQDAEDQQAALSDTIEEDDARAEELREAIVELARAAYRSGTTSTSIEVILGATSVEDFAERYGLASTALRSQAQVLDELNQTQAANRTSQARLTAVRDQIAELKVEADEKLAAADAAEQAAAAAKAKVEQLEAEQEAKQAALEEHQDELEAQLAQQDAAAQSIQDKIDDLIAQQEARDAASGTPSGSISGAVFSNPTSISPIYVTSEYGMRYHPTLHYWRLHAGIDLRTWCNTPIYAARAGTVVWAKYLYGYGNQVLIDHGYVDGNSLMASYNHMTSFVVSAGEKVTQGQLIGYSGNTGTSAACHLHFEVYVNGSTVNPRPLLGL